MTPETENDDGESNQFPVFIDTSLDTHIVTMVSNSHTALELKKKIVLEHRQCFPTIGDIKIHGLKVKRRGKLYNISDCMLVKNAFLPTKTQWFVSVDASRIDQLALPWVTEPLETSQKEKGNEMVQKTLMGNELPSSSMRPKLSERPTKRKAAEKESSTTSVIKKLDNINKDVIDSSQQDVGSTVQKSPGKLIHKEEQGAEVKLPEKRKRAKKSTAKSKDESLVKCADNLVDGIDISLKVPAPVFDERNEFSEKTSFNDSKIGEEIIVKEVEISEPTNSQVPEEMSRPELKDNLRSRNKETDAEKSASKIDESVVKHTNDTTSVTNEVNVLPSSERKENLQITSTNAEISRNEHDVSQVNTEGNVDNSKKKNDIVGSRKKKKSASRNDESVIKHMTDTANVTNEEIVLSQSERKESPEIALTDTEISRNKKNLSQVNAEGINGNSEKQNDTMDATKKRKRKTGKSAARNDESVIKHMSDTVAVANEEIVLSRSDEKQSPEIALTDAEISRKKNEVNTEGINGNSEKQNDMMDVTKKRKRKTEKSASRNENKSISKHSSSDICENVNEGESSLLPDTDKKDNDKVKGKDAEIFDERVIRTKKNKKPSVTITRPQALPSGLQSAELELESKKSQAVDHDHLPEEALKNVTVSEVSEVANSSRNSFRSKKISMADLIRSSSRFKKAKLTVQEDDTEKSAS